MDHKPIKEGALKFIATLILFKPSHTEKTHMWQNQQGVKRVQQSIIKQKTSKRGLQLKKATGTSIMYKVKTATCHAGISEAPSQVLDAPLETQLRGNCVLALHSHGRPKMKLLSPGSRLTWPFEEWIRMKDLSFCLCVCISLSLCAHACNSTFCLSNK